MLVERIKARLLEARKANRAVEREILRVALGEIQTAESRSSEVMTDASAQAVIRKLLKANDESLAQVQEEAQRAALAQENEILRSLLPQSLTVEQIVNALEPVVEQLRAAKAVGPATGIAMKHLKSNAVAVEGKDVAEAVNRIRS